MSGSSEGGPEESTPDWELLGDDPEAFFGLGEGWDRRDLKRAYGRWIKRFKPDREPEAFRKLRAAYEELEDRLRFSRADEGAAPAPAPSGPLPERSPGSDSDSPESGPASGPASAPVERELPDRADFLAHMRRDGPGAVLAQAAEDFPRWWAPTYLSLFLSGDELAADEPFEKRLVSALHDHPREPVLLNLARAWVRRRVQAPDALELLGRMKSLPPMTLAVVGAPLLRELARAGRGDELRRELERLERSTDREGRAAFAAVLEECLLAAAMTVEPARVSNWLDEIALDQTGRFDLDDAYVEAAGRILTWRATGEAEDATPATGWKGTLEAALMDLATGDEPLRMRTLLALGARIRSSPREVAAKLRTHDERTLALVHALGIFGLPFDGGVEPTDAEQQAALSATGAFLEEMTDRTDASTVGRLWTLMPLAAWTLAAMVLGLAVTPLTAAFEVFWAAPSPAPTTDGADAGFAWVSALAGIGLTVILQAMRRTRANPLGPISRLLRRAEDRTSLYLYRSIWRRRLLEFAVLQPWSGHQLVAIFAMTSDDDGSTVRSQIGRHLGADPAVYLRLLGRDLEA